jgi:hypothetical protein
MRTIFISLLLLAYSFANSIYVGSCGAPSYASIQSAINTANAYDTIYICDDPDHKGYEESFFINKSIHLTSFSQDATKVTLNPTKNASTSTIRISDTALDVNISHVTIQNTKADQALEQQIPLNSLYLDHITIDATNKAYNANSLSNTLFIANSSLTSSKDSCLFFYGSEFVHKTMINHTTFNCANEAIIFKNITSNTTITHSTIASKDEAAIRFTRASTTPINITNNTITSEKKSALSFEESITNGLQIDSNTFESKFKNLINTIYIDELNASNQISNNTILQGEIGLYIRLTLVGANVIDNNFSNFKTNSLKLLNQSTQASYKSQIYGNCFESVSVLNYDISADFNNSTHGNYWGYCPTNYQQQIAGQNDVAIYDYKPLQSCGSLTLCQPQSTPSYKFDAYDTFRSLNDRNISTKIAQQDFTLTIAEINATDFNGTVCVTLDHASWAKALFSNQHEQTVNFNHPRASKNIQPLIYYRANQNIICNSANNDGNTSYTTDTFAIRPEKFTIQSIDETNASQPFSLTFVAGPTPGYNETIGTTFFIESNTTNSNCSFGTLFIPNDAFTNGTLSFSTNFSDVGEQNITIQEYANNSFALVDSDDTNESQRLIQSDSKKIYFSPYEYNITDFDYQQSTPKMWEYMDDLLEKNITISFQVAALGYTGSLVQNFDTQCYAKDINLSIDFETPTFTTYVSNQSTNSTTSLDLNTTLSKQSFSLGKSTPFSYSYNIARSISTTQNPIDINLSSIQTQVPNAINNIFTVERSIPFYYARAYASDTKITTPTNLASKIEIYCKACVDLNSSWVPSADGVFWYILEDINFTTHFINHTQLISIPSAKYLRHNIFGENVDNSFYVEYINKNDNNETTFSGKYFELNASTRSNSRIEW